MGPESESESENFDSSFVLGDKSIFPKKKVKVKVGLLPMKGLSILKANACKCDGPCHADVVVIESSVPCTLTSNYKRKRLIVDF